MADDQEKGYATKKTVEGVTSQDNLSWDERNGNSNGTQDALQQKECIPGYMDERLEVDNEHQKIDSASDTSSLGLTLVKTKSLLDIVELKLLNLNDAPPNETTQSYKLEKEESRNNTCITQRTPEKLKAANFPATLLRIGQWERISQNEGDILGKCYFAKRRLVWEVLDGALKSKIEVPWSEISAIRATFADGLPSILDVELQKPPELFREMEPQPRKHAIWARSQDFTNGQAPTYRRHHLEFREGILEKHYEQLLHCDKRLFVLSQRPFPSSSSPYFNTVHTTPGFPFDPDIHRSKYLPMYNLMSKDLFQYQFPCVGHPRAITARNTGVFEPLRSMGVVSQTPFLNPMVGAMGVNAPFSVFNFSPSKQTCATLPTDTRTCLSATNFLPSHDNSALNQLPYESTPIWNQRAQQQWSFFNVPSPQTGELPLNAAYATLVPNFLPQQGLASNLSSSTAAAETDHSYSSLIQEIKEHLLGDAPTDSCSDEEKLLAEVNSIECLINTTAQPTSEPESSNMVQDRQCIDGEEDESKVLDDSKQSESDDDTEVLVMNLPRVSSDPLLI